MASLAAALVACGGGQSQDATEPSGDFPVEVTKAKFPSRQQLAGTTDLELAIKNAGDKTIPNLAVTIYTLGSKSSGSTRTKAGVTATGTGEGSFSIQLESPNLANPNRPVWILENRYPKLLGGGVTLKNLGEAPPAGAVAAQTDTFQFGPVKPGKLKDIAWRVTPVRAGTYSVHYVIAAGLEGKAKAVANGGPAKGRFLATISSKPPQSCVNGAGQVVTSCGP